MWNWIHKKANSTSPVKPSAIINWPLRYHAFGSYCIICVKFFKMLWKIFHLRGIKFGSAREFTYMYIISFELISKRLTSNSIHELSITAMWTDVTGEFCRTIKRKLIVLDCFVFKAKWVNFKIAYHFRLRLNSSMWRGLKLCWQDRVKGNFPVHTEDICKHDVFASSAKLWSTNRASSVSSRLNF